jgi:iron complex outermembrane recepter protein
VAIRKRGRQLALVFAVILAFRCGYCQNFPAQKDQLAENGANPLKGLSLEELGNVNVTATTKEDVPVRRTAAATYVITQEDIRRSGATSIADVLRLAPGVEVGRISSTTWAVGIRGLQSNFSKSVLVLIDGRSVYTPLFAGVYWDVQDVVLEDIDRIEVIRGPGATIWGTNSANGVINIVTKNSAQTQGVLVSASGGNVDLTNDAVRFGGAIGDHLHYRIFGKGLARAPEFHSDRNNFDRWHQERGGFRADWESGNDTVVVDAAVYGGNSPHLLGTTISNDSVSGGHVLARWRRDLGRGSDIYVQTYFDRTIRAGVLLGDSRNTFDVDFLHHLKVGERQDFSWGGGLRWSPNRVTTLPGSGVDVIPEDLTDYVHSGFAQDEIHFLQQKFTLTVGTKLLYNNFSGFDIQPTARLLFAPNNKQSFWGAVTRGVTTPSRIEEGFLLTGVSPGLELRVVGNPNFKSETVVGFEGGYRHLFTPNVALSLSVFHNRYRDLQSFGAAISTVETTPPRLVLTIPYGNDIAGTTDGVEIAPSWQVASRWKLTGSYSYVGISMHANAPTSDISATGSVPTYEGSTPEHLAKIQSSFNLPGGFEFDQFYTYASQLPAQKVPAYHSMDARFGWRWGDKLDLSVVGQNLFQPHHLEWGTGDPGQTPVGIRRAFYGKIVFRK